VSESKGGGKNDRLDNDNWIRRGFSISSNFESRLEAKDVLCWDFGDPHTHTTQDHIAQAQYSVQAGFQYSRDWDGPHDDDG